MTIVYILLALAGVAVGVFMSFMKNIRKTKRDQVECLIIDPSVPLGMPAVETKRMHEQTKPEVRVTKPKREAAVTPRTPRVTDPLERYKRRYGLCGRFSRRARRSRQEAARRALEDAIRRHDVPKLELLRTLGIH